MKLEIKSTYSVAFYTEHVSSSLWSHGVVDGMVLKPFCFISECLKLTMNMKEGRERRYERE